MIRLCKIGVALVAAESGDLVDPLVGVHQIVLGRVAAQAVEMLNDADARGGLDTAAHIRGCNADLLGDGFNGEILRQMLAQKVDYLYRDNEVRVLFLRTFVKMVTLKPFKGLQNKLLNSQCFMLLDVSSLHRVFFYDVQKRLSQPLIADVGLEENIVVVNSQSLKDLVGRDDAMVHPILSRDGVNSAAVDHNDVSGACDVAVVLYKNSLRARNRVDEFRLAVPVGEKIVSIGAVVHIDAAREDSVLKI